MLGGILKAIGRLAAASRGSLKISLGVNPNQPFELRGWLSQFFQGGGGAMSSARESGMSSGASQAIIDQVNRRPSPSAPPPSSRAS